MEIMLIPSFKAVQILQKNTRTISMGGLTAGRHGKTGAGHKERGDRCNPIDASKIAYLVTLYDG
jgi:hypothetical protein